MGRDRSRGAEQEGVTVAEVVGPSSVSASAASPPASSPTSPASASAVTMDTIRFNPKIIPYSDCLYNISINISDVSILSTI